MKVFLDDIRPAPAGWVLVKTAEEALALLRGGEVTEISLDHDLDMAEVSQTESGLSIGQSNPGALTGFWLLEQMKATGAWPTKKIHVHSRSEHRWEMKKFIRDYCPLLVGISA